MHIRKSKLIVDMFGDIVESENTLQSFIKTNKQHSVLTWHCCLRVVWQQISHAL